MKQRRKAQPESAAVPIERRQIPLWPWIALMALCVAVFYWVPMTSDSASIQWDAADMHYPLQKYVSDHIRAGQLPFWTPYLFSGYPFLANPEIAVWYLPHWPVFLMGVTPRGIQFEIVLNAFGACLGAFLLISRHVANRGAALFGALCYGLSGFFAGHSSHVGLFSAAAGLPWLLLAFRKAMGAMPLRYVALGGLAGGAIILAGYVQTAMYAFLALGLYAISDLYRTPRLWARIVSTIAAMLGLALGVAAIQILPGLELAEHSIRAASNFSTSTQGVLRPLDLATLIIPNALGLISGKYVGANDRTQGYFYSGLLLIPLAALCCLKNGKVRAQALLLIVPSVWYMLGPQAGLYRLGALAPGLHKVRAPIQGWFVPALGLALLAAAGFEWAVQRWRFRYLGPVLLVILFADVWYWNSWANPLAYTRYGFDQLYGNKEELVRRQIGVAQPALTRFDAPRNSFALGPLDDPLDLKLETTYGYVALEPSAYDEYADAMRRNPKLRDGLNVSRFLDPTAGTVKANPSVLPRVYFPKAIKDVNSAEESRRALETVDPASTAIALRPHAPVQQDPAATVSVLSYDENSYRVHYTAASPSLLRFSVTWYPGWQAYVSGRELPVIRVDHALMGVVVPQGSQELTLQFRSRYFGAGALVSIAALLCAVAMVVWPFRNLGKIDQRIQASRMPAARV